MKRRTLSEIRRELESRVSISENLSEECMGDDDTLYYMGSMHTLNIVLRMLSGRFDDWVTRGK